MKRKKPIDPVEPWPATERPGARFIASVGRHGGGSRGGAMSIVLIKKPRGSVFLPHAGRIRNVRGVWGEWVKRARASAHHPRVLENLTTKYTMARKGRMTHRRKSHKKSMRRRSTRKQQRGGGCNPPCQHGMFCDNGVCYNLPDPGYGA